MADHVDHDVERLVDYVDDELDPEARIAVERQVAECADCAQLVADLRALAVAHVAAPAPLRSRDFRLTAADAARLRAEPDTGPTRLVLEMPNLPTAHADHDPLLIAAASDARLEPAERERVDSWLAICTDCVSLRDDLVAIAAANRVLWTPSRARDFRLDEATAAAISRRGWRGLLRWIGSSRDSLTRPLAVGLTTLGIAGLLLSGSASLLSFGSSASGALVLSTIGAPIGGASGAQEDQAAPSVISDRNVFTGQGEAPAAPGSDTGAGGAAPLGAASAAASGAPVAAASAAAAAQPLPSEAAALAMPSAGPTDQSDTSTQIEAASPADDAARVAAKDETSTGVPPLVLLSAALLVGGLGLFVVRRAMGTSGS